MRYATSLPRLPTAALPSRRQIAHRLTDQQAAVSSAWHALQHEPGQASCVAAPLHGCCKSTLDSAKCPGSVGCELVGAMDVP